MKFKVFCIWDSKAEAFLPPFYLPQTAMAVRTFSDCVNNKDHAFGAHPEDYTLFELGDWDAISGEHNLRHMESLHNGVQLVKDASIRSVENLELALTEKVQ